MKLFLSGDDFNNLKILASTSQKEISGCMTFMKDDDNYSLSSIKVFDASDRRIISSSKKEVDVDLKRYMTDVVYEAYNSGFDEMVIVRFHSHPNSLGKKGVASPSDADKQFIQSMQTVLDGLEKMNKKFTYVEGIITDSDIGFYFYDGSIKRVTTFIDFVEHVPQQHDRRTLRESFLAGIRRGRGN